MTEKVLDLVGSLNLDNRVVISSFNLDAIRTVKELAPHIETGALFMRPLKNPLDYLRTIPTDALHIKARAALKPSMRQAITEGVIVRVFTINTSKYVDALEEIGVDAIFTDYPEKLYKYIEDIMKSIII